MPDWPTIDEPELLERLAMSDREFQSFVRGLVERVPVRPFEAVALERALGYPWERPPGSYELREERVLLLSELEEVAREELIRRYTTSPDLRLPVLAIGSNAAPEVLERKFAHFEAVHDRTVLALTGRLHDFDVGAAAQPAVYGSMPATLFPSEGTEVAATVLWVTPAQFTQLTWSELSYRLGRLHTRFEIDEVDVSFDDVLVFVSRFGSFRVDGEPVALRAVPARGRRARALSQEEILAAAAVLALGEGATAETLVRAIHEDIGGLAAKVAATVWTEAEPFESERWTPFQPDR